MAELELLENIIMSMNPCPVCVEASQADPMTHEEWATSEYGLPGSSARYCEDNCHCVLLPKGLIKEFPALDEHVKLRNEEGSEIAVIIDIGPKETGLKDAMDTWNAKYGKLPAQIYDMALDDIEPYLRKLMEGQ